MGVDRIYMVSFYLDLSWDGDQGWDPVLHKTDWGNFIAGKEVAAKLGDNVWIARASNQNSTMCFRISKYTVSKY
jgi:hypothetical protein